MRVEASFLLSLAENERELDLEGERESCNLTVMNLCQLHFALQILHMSKGDNGIRSRARGKNRSNTNYSVWDAKIMDDMREASASFWNRNAVKLRGALIFVAIALAVCLVIGLGVHKPEGKVVKAPAVVNRLPIEGMLKFSNFGEKIILTG